MPIYNSSEFEKLEELAKQHNTMLKIANQTRKKNRMNKQNTPRKPQTHFRATWAAVLPLYTTVKT